MKKNLFLIWIAASSYLHAEYYSCQLSFSNTSYAYHVNVAAYYALDNGNRYNTIIVSYGDEEYRTGQSFFGTGKVDAGLESFRSVHLEKSSARFGHHMTNGSNKLILEYPGERSVYQCTLIK